MTPAAVPFLRPTFPPPEEIAEDYEAIVASGIFANGGPKERELAAATAAWIGQGVRTALAASGTSALLMACATCFLPDRPKVIVPSFTFPAGPLALRWCGFEPVFIDIDPKNWQGDAGAAARRLQREPTDIAGILLTATFGVTVDTIHEWEAIAERHDVPLVIDMAAGFGSAYPSGERAGARGSCEVFSFHATKTLAIGEGGLVASRDRSLIETIDRLKNFGFDQQGRVTELGMNAKLAELPAAIGLRQLAVLPRRIARRQALYDVYVEALHRLGVEFQPSSGFSALPFVSALLPEQAIRDAALDALSEEAIGCRTYYNPPMHDHPFFSDADREGPLTVTRDMSSRVISLPMADDLKDEVVGRIARIVEQAIDHA